MDSDNRKVTFSSKVRAELSRSTSPARHCQLAELAAMICFCGRYDAKDEIMYIQTENDAVVRKCFTLLKKAYNIVVNQETVGAVSEAEGYSTFHRLFSDAGEEEKVLSGLKMLDDAGNICGPGQPVNGLLIKNACCRRAYLRGAFLCTGSVSDPAKGYHLEFVCGSMEQAAQIQGLIHGFEIEAHTIMRKKYHVVYVKEGEAISDLLNVMGAYVSLMDLENMRILKDVRNSVNRRVNCETANIGKTVTAASRQIEDIQYITEHYGLEHLPESLREMAEVRTAHPDAPLKELGQYMYPPVGKSGVNHRLRKLSEIAESIR